MHIVEDTRNKPGKHARKHVAWAAHGDTVTRCALPVGDYAIFPEIAVDTKANMEEIATNIGGATEEHARFRRELQRAQEHGCRLYVLVENDDGIRTLDDVATWVNPRLVDSPKAITGDRLQKAMQTMAQRYGVRWVFCAPEQAAGLVHLLLEKG